MRAPQKEDSMLKAATAALAVAFGATPAPSRGLSPGEEILLSVSYLGLPTGEGRIAVGTPEGTIFPVFFQARTRGVAGFLDIREALVSYWDHSTRLSRGSDLKAIELGDFHQDSARFDREKHQITVVIQRKGRRTEKTVSCPADAQDLTSAFMWLRMQPLAAGDRYEVPVCSGTDTFTLTAEVLSRERVDTDAGPFDAVKVKVRTALKGNFSTKRDTFLWFSEEPRHVLVKLQAEFAIGSIVAKLKSYRPGDEVAAAR
jgi:hypothetical protein